MGFPAEVTEWCSCSISENAVCRPYHWASYCLRPSALVMGSLNDASSYGCVNDEAWETTQKCESAYSPELKFLERGTAGEELVIELST